ncbi:thiolase family protein [Desulfotomaculum sp. 1211_IL3151]|uniref:thiolase family protein n=1 Tax=Desulfotomaculum sp. 1211_IL3151 TaxID=3084055 RepID=UPI002FDB202D
MKKVVITSAARTPVGAFLGGLKTVPVEDLAAIAVKEAVRRSNLDPKAVESVIMGHVEGSMDVTNLGRHAALLAGCENAHGMQVNRICGSGFQSIVSGWHEILTGVSEIVVAGGAESLSRAPYYLPLNVRYEGFKNNSQKLKCANEMSHMNAAPSQMYPQVWMGVTAENIVERYEISREDQDLFAYESQMKNKAAVERGRFEREIVPVEIKSRKGSTYISKDEHAKPDTTLESLAKLKPAFKKDGTVTAGNATGLNDGAAALVLMSEEKAKSLGLEPMAYIVDYAIGVCDPMVMGLGPAYGIPKLLNKVGLKMTDIDLYEINEAFAGQVLGCLRMMDVYMNESEVMYPKLNVNGSGLAMGHPLGMTGSRIAMTLAYEMMERQVRYGVCTACIGGGMGLAILLERP